MSESLSRLERDQLRKFAQYLIARLPEQILPVAQKILDDLLSQAETGGVESNSLSGKGANLGQNIWEKKLVRAILGHFDHVLHSLPHLVSISEIYLFLCLLPKTKCPRFACNERSIK